MLLESFTRYIQWQVIGIDNTSDEGQVVGHHVFEVIGDEDSSNVQFDLFIHASIFVEGFGWLVDGDKEEGFEGDFSFGNKVSVGHGSVGIFGD